MGEGRRKKAEDNDPVAQEKIIKYNDLVANAVIFQNVVDLTDILRDLLKAGHFINREDVAALSPYMTSHIKRFGNYLIDMEVPNLLAGDGLLKKIRLDIKEKKLQLIKVEPGGKETLLDEVNLKQEKNSFNSEFSPDFLNKWFDNINPTEVTLIIEN